MSDTVSTPYDIDKDRSAHAGDSDMVCRICGQRITLTIRDNPCWAGTSTNPRAFLAHGECWEAAPPRERWKWPTDA